PAKAGIQNALDSRLRGNDGNSTTDTSAWGRLLTVTDEQPGPEGEVIVTLTERRGLIHADLSVGAKLADAQALKANLNLSNRGVQLFGAGFILTIEEAAALGNPAIVKNYRNGRDLTDAPRGVKVIDAFGLSADELRSQFPAAYQWLLERVKPERDQNNRASYRDNWWFFGEPRKVLRQQLAGLPRYIATVETAKHRLFQFLDASILPDNKLVAIALNDAFHLGVLSSQLHGLWALAAGSWLGVGNDPVYVKSRCFETFPFPDDDTGLTPALRQKISLLAEQIDQHRKRVLGLLPSNASSPAQATTPGRVLPGADFWAFDSMRPPAIPDPAHPELANPPFEAPNQPQALMQQAPAAINKIAPVAPASTPTTSPKPGRVLPGADLASEASMRPLAIAAPAHPEHQHPMPPQRNVPKPTPHSAITAPTSSKPAKDLTLTGLYNVLQALREGRALTAKEKQIHSAGLVGVLKTLHDELDAAVLAAYGWADELATAPTSTATAGDFKDKLLQRLVALNQRRAAEEARGQVRWLRPTFQNSLSKTELPAQVQQGLEVDLASNSAAPVATTQAWPGTLPEQVKAVALVLSSSTAALTQAQIEACFSGSSSLKKSLPTLLQTLAALGRAQQSESDDGITVWRA
ncbi:MAG: hypothetical protein ACOYNF_12715, partial [Rhodoferax sp.]